MAKEMTITDVLQRPEEFRYQLLDRMKQDCDVFLSGGKKNESRLWAHDADKQIEYMKAIWDSFPADKKPQWLNKAQLERYMDNMKLKPFELVRFQVTGKELYVQASDYESALNWVKNNFGSAEVSLADFEPEMTERTADEKVAVIEARDLDEPSMIFKRDDFTDDVLYNFLNKGYDVDRQAWHMVVADVTVGRLSTQGRDVNAVLGRIDRGELSFDEALSERKVISADMGECVTIDNHTYDIYSTDDLAEVLKTECPDGLTVRLMDESLENLMAYRDLAQDSADTTLLQGGVNMDENDRLLKAYGTLGAELKLSPGDYTLLEPCEQTYYLDELSDLGFDTGVNAATDMINQIEETGIKYARVEVVLQEKVLDNLYIEGVPFAKVMELAGQYGLKSDEEQKLHYAIDRYKVEQQPEWKQKLADEQTRPVMQKYWVEVQGPAYRKAVQMTEALKDEVARKYGWKDGADWQNDAAWTKNPSPEWLDRFNGAQREYLARLDKEVPHASKVDMDAEMYRTKQHREFIERFDKTASKVISDVRISQKPDGIWSVRCKVDGRQMVGRSLSGDDAQCVKDREKGFVSEIGSKYFSAEVIDAMQQKQSQGRKR